jgi:hypothetical protein
MNYSEHNISKKVLNSILDPVALLIMSQFPQSESLDPPFNAAYLKIENELNRPVIIKHIIAIALRDTI